MKVIAVLSSIFLVSACSLFGIQNEEGPKYSVLVKEGPFEIREYASYIVAKTTVKGSYKQASSKAFRILAGYIFGKNRKKQKISMTSPVQISASSEKIAMTSPVLMQEENDQLTMSFFMPSEYTREELPEPEDKSITFETMPARLVATHRYSWLSGKKKNEKKALELRNWLKKYPKYKAANTYVFAGHNPPWTIPFLKRNEVMIELENSLD